MQQAKNLIPKTMRVIKMEESGKVTEMTVKYTEFFELTGVWARMGYDWTRDYSSGVVTLYAWKDFCR